MRDLSILSGQCSSNQDTRLKILIKMKKSLLLFFLILIGLSGIAQTSLKDCINSALGSHPALKSGEYLGLINQKELENNNTHRLPSFNIGAQGKYQSDVVEFDFDLPFEGLSFPEIPHFQYNMSLYANQLLYDGGKRKLEKNLINVEHKERMAGLEARAREIKESVQELYLEILLRDKQLDVIQLLQRSVDVNLARLEAGYGGGVVSDMDVKLLEAEKIDMRRKLLTLREARNALIEQLALLCKLDLEPDDEFSIPEVSYILQAPERSEYDIFSYRNQALQLRKKMMGLKTIPRLSAFGQAGYGRPGLNFMSDEWQDFYVMGLRFSWIPWDYGETKRKQAIIDLNSMMLNYEQENFDLQLQSAIARVLSRIQLLEQIIKEDGRMVEVRELIRLSMEKRLNDGVITSAEYITELNREKQARLDLERSKLDLLANQLAYMVIIGK